MDVVVLWKSSSGGVGGKEVEGSEVEVGGGGGGGRCL